MESQGKKIKRVLLIAPFSIENEYDFSVVRNRGQFVEAPLGLCYISANLKDKIPDISVSVLDANMMAVEEIIKGESSMKALWGMLRQKIVDFSPDLVGISCLFHFTAKVSHKTCELVKNISPEIITVMGGTYPTISVESALEDKNLDFVIFSEGETGMVDLVKILISGRDLNSLDGIAFKAGNPERVIIKPKTKWIANLDSLPFPDRSSIPLMNYFGAGRNFMDRLLDEKETRLVTMTATRGCPNNCTFCCATKYWGRRLRVRSPENVVDEMQLLINKYGANTFVFHDDNLSNNYQFVMGFTNEIIKRKLNIRWTTGGGFQISSLKPDVIENMYKSGIIYFSLGIESGVESTLRRIRKPLLLNMVPKVISDIRKYGQGYVLGFFITGFPFETLQDIDGTLDYAGSLDLDWRQFSAFQPIPGTVDYEESVKNGYIKPSDIKWGDWAMSLNINTENFTSERLFAKNYHANLEYNFLNSRNLKNGNVRQAVRDFEYVIKFVPDHAIAYYTLGNALALLGEKEKALDKWRTADNIVKQNPVWQKYFNDFKTDLVSKLNPKTNA